MDVGPVINQSGLDSALAHVADAVAKGGRIVAGGKRLSGSRGVLSGADRP